jgi:hypothetical protein
MLPPYIPSDAKWYIAEIVLEIKIEDEEENIVEIDYLLVRADSPQEAYEEAIKLGEEHAGSYQNTDDKTVVTVFRGFRHLDVIHEELEHGAEIMYDRKESLSEEEVRKLIRPKEELNLFKLRKADED